MSRHRPRLEDLLLIAPGAAGPHGQRLRGARPRRPAGRRRAARAGRRRPPQLLNPLAPKAAAVPGEGEARHLPVHERRAVARRHVRPQADAHEVCRASRCPCRTCRPSGRPAPAARRRSQFKKYGQSGIEVSEIFPHIADLHRRHRGHPLDARGRAEPRAVAAADELRRGAADPPEHGLVGHLRPGHREPEPARLHRHVPAAAIRSRTRRTGSPASCPASSRAPTSTRSRPTSRS